MAPDDGDLRRIGRPRLREGQREPRRRRADDAAADVGGEALAGAAQVQREDQRDVVAPEAELRDGEEAGDEDADLDQSSESGVARFDEIQMKSSGTKISAGIWKIRSSDRRVIAQAAISANTARPARPPISCHDDTVATA